MLIAGIKDDVYSAHCKTRLCEAVTINHCMDQRIRENPSFGQGVDNDVPRAKS